MQKVGLGEVNRVPQKHYASEGLASVDATGSALVGREGCSPSVENLQRKKAYSETAEPKSAVIC